MLHILLSSPQSIQKSSFFSFCVLQDDLICIQDGVILSVMNSLFFQRIYKKFNLIYFLQEDLSARGLLSIAKSKNLILIDYERFAYLTVCHNKNMTW